MDTDVLLMDHKQGSISLWVFYYNQSTVFYSILSLFCQASEVASSSLVGQVAQRVKPSPQGIFLQLIPCPAPCESLRLTLFLRAFLFQF